MPERNRRGAYSGGLGVEAYWFQGLSRPFPAHFHPYYVAGLVEKGERKLLWCGEEYRLEAGDMLLLNPGESHACAELGGGLNYRSVNLPPRALTSLTGDEASTFSGPVLRDKVLAAEFRILHLRLLEGEEIGEALGLFLKKLPLRQAEKPKKSLGRQEVEAACAFMAEHLGERISLDRLCRRTGLSRSTLLRSFLREKGVTPYQYLEAVRISAAKALLDQGVSPLEAALETRFSDQSHFTNTFTRLMGLPPGEYQALRKAEQEEPLWTNKPKNA